ncbi:hypothetical protein Baya_2503 [Bagarius yarrelli]|uniref:Uncharacterized protein n=1 Tax=Bagarius yarrelli TaxID=175774 RepID=A0A556VXP2_BAGYA|nr:hypothetical protein Baya_2503 [Bagarius yarrelli]
MAERQRWLSLTDLQDRDKADVLYAPLHPQGLLASQLVPSCNGSWRREDRQQFSNATCHTSLGALSLGEPPLGGCGSDPRRPVPSLSQAQYYYSASAQGRHSKAASKGVLVTPLDGTWKALGGADKDEETDHPLAIVEGTQL